MTMLGYGQSGRLMTASLGLQHTARLALISSLALALALALPKVDMIQNSERKL